MDSYVEEEELNRNLISAIIHIFVSTAGFIFYLIVFILFNFYFKCPSLIKKEIFTFIFLYSIKTIVEILLSSILSQFICYIIDIISFYLIITYINKCLVSKKLSENSISFQLVHKNYMCLIFIICSFTLVKIFNLSQKFNLVENIINIVGAFIIFKYIRGKYQHLLEYLKEKKMTNTKIPDIYLPYMKAHFYYISFNNAYFIFYNSFVIIIFYFSLNIIYFIFKTKYLFFVAIICEKCAYICLIIGCLLLFYSLYKKLLGIGKNDENDEEGNISNFTVIDVDIQQEEKEENSSLGIRKKRGRKNKTKFTDNNYIKIEGEEIKENEKDNDNDKDNNIKGMEESESLNK